MIPELNASHIVGAATSKASNEERNPKTIASKVQAMFMEVMIKTMEESIGAEDGLFGGGSSSDIYRGMFREHLAASLSGRLAGELQEQIESGVRGAGEHKEEHPGKSEGLKDLNLPVAGVVTSEVGWRRDPFTGGMKLHKGTDIAAARGTPIQAVAGGVVVESGVKGTYGNTVVVRTDDGRHMLYAHNQQNYVRVGDRVDRGDAIATIGSTGRATGPHVHFEVRE